MSDVKVLGILLAARATGTGGRRPAPPIPHPNSWTAAGASSRVGTGPQPLPCDSQARSIPDESYIQFRSGLEPA